MNSVDTTIEAIYYAIIGITTLPSAIKGGVPGKIYRKNEGDWCGVGAALALCSKDYDVLEV